MKFQTNILLRESHWIQFAKVIGFEFCECYYDDATTLMRNKDETCKENGLGINILSTEIIELNAIRIQQEQGW